MSRVAQQALFAAASAPATISYVGLTAVATTTATPTITGVAIGAEANNRTVFVCVHWYTSVGKTLASATIGGVAATVHAQTSGLGSGAYLQSAIISASLPTGTTATVTLNFTSGSTYYKAAISVYRATGLVSTSPGDTISTAVSAVASYSGNIDVVKNGILVICGMLYANVTGYNMSGLTKDYSSAIASFYWVAGGNLAVTATEANRTVGITLGGGSTAGAFYGAITAAAFR